MTPVLNQTLTPEQPAIWAPIGLLLFIAGAVAAVLIIEFICSAIVREHRVRMARVRRMEQREREQR
jgi:uncharacterized protein (DUF2062 family)